MKRFALLITIIIFAACATAAFGATQGPLLGAWTTVTTTGTYTPRTHAASGYGNLRIVVIGGVDGSGNVVDTVEGLKVTTNIWQTYSPMPTARRDAAVVSTADSKIYVIGGADADGNALKTVEVFDAVGNTWTAKAPIPTARIASVAVLANVGGKNEIHVYGATPGADYPDNTAYDIYDIATDTWRKSSHIAPSPQSEACGCLAKDLGSDGGDYLYLFGGYSGGAAVTSGAWRISSSGAENWDSEVHSMPQARIQAAAVTVTAGSPDSGGTGQYPLIIGGNSDRGGALAGTSIMCYESGIYNGWVSGSAIAPDLPEARGDRPAAIVAGGAVWVVGGSTGGGIPATSVFKALINTSNYPPAPALENPLLVGWENVSAPIPTPRWYTVSAAVGNKLYVMGGWATNSGYEAPAVGTNEVYDTVANTWATMAPMPVPVRGAACAAIGTKIYVAGGSKTARDVPDYEDTLQIYDTTTNSWTTGAPMPTPRDLVTGCALDGKFHVLAGTAQDDTGAQVNTGAHEIYDPGTDTWSVSSVAAPWAMADAGMCTIQSGGNDWAYFCGGWNWGTQQSMSARWNSVIGGPNNDAFAQFASMPVGGNSGLTMATVTDASGAQWPVAFGGNFGGMGYINKVFVYHDFADALFSNQWVKDTSMPWGRGGRMAVAQIGDFVYVAAGMGPLGLATDTFRSAVGSGLPVDVTTVGEAVNQPNGKKITITEPKVVTRVYTDFDTYESYIWIEESNRSSAVKVGPVTEAVNPGNKVVVSGTVNVDSAGQKTITPTSITVDANVYPIPQPIGITNRSFIGGSKAYIPGRPGGTGLNNMGMLVTIWGRVTAEPGMTTTGEFYIDDGSGLVDGTSAAGTQNQGIRVYHNWYSSGWYDSPLGKLVSVTGIISAESVDGQMVPMLISDEVTMNDPDAVQFWN